MSRSYLDHPTEEALERFLLHHAQEDELDKVETHILACDACVSRLEELELQMAAAKLALQELSREPKPENAHERRFRKEWFTFRTLSWASAVAAVALTVTVAPRFVSRSAPAADVSLSANRGSDIPVVPLARPLHLHLSAQDIANGPVRVVMVDSNGSEVWRGAARAQHEQVEVSIPELKQAGEHYLRLYAAGRPKGEDDLLREFAFEVR